MHYKGELCDSQPLAHALSTFVFPGIFDKALLCYLLHHVGISCSQSFPPGLNFNHGCVCLQVYAGMHPHTSVLNYPHQLQSHKVGLVTMNRRK